MKIPLALCCLVAAVAPAEVLENSRLRVELRPDASLRLTDAAGPTFLACRIRRGNGTVLRVRRSADGRPLAESQRVYTYNPELE